MLASGAGQMSASLGDLQHIGGFSADYTEGLDLTTTTDNA